MENCALLNEVNGKCPLGVCPYRNHILLRETVCFIIGRFFSYIASKKHSFLHTINCCWCRCCGCWLLFQKKKNENFNIYTNIVQTLQGECRKFLFDNIIEYKCILYRMLWHYGTIGTRQSDATHIVHFECCKTSLGSFYCGQFVVHVCRNFLCFCFQFFWFRCECSMRLHCWLEKPVSAGGKQHTHTNSTENDRFFFLDWCNRRHSLSHYVLNCL